MGQLYYNYRDILKAPRLALMGKNIFLMMSHLIVGYFIYLVLTYFAILIDGHAFSKIWNYFQLFPVGKMPFDIFWSKLLWFLGILFLIALFLRGSLGVARSAFEELRGNFFFSIGEAMKFIGKNCWIVYRAILGVVIFITFLILLGIIVGLIAKIPVVGELFYGFFYDFPFFIVSLFAALVIFLLFTLFLTGPAVVAIKGEDSMTALFDGFSAITSQPLRWVSYLVGSSVLAKISSFILTYFSLRAIQFTNWTSHITMGEKQADLFAIGAQTVFDKFPLTQFFTNLYPGLSIHIDNILRISNVSDTSWSMTAGGFFIMLSIVFILFFLTSYFLNTLICAQVIAFLDIRNATHQEKLAFIPDDELNQHVDPDMNPDVSEDETLTENQDN